MFSHSGFQRPGVFNRHRLGLRHYPAHALHGHRLHCRLQVEDVKVHGAIDDGPIRRIHCCVGLHIAMCFRNLSNKYFNGNIFLVTLTYKNGNVYFGPFRPFTRPCSTVYIYKENYLHLIDFS